METNRKGLERTGEEEHGNGKEKDGLESLRDEKHGDGKDKNGVEMGTEQKRTKSQWRRKERKCEVGIREGEERRGKQ